MKYIAIDADGTIVKHEYPKMGEDVPGAEETIKALVKAGHKIIIFTMRSGKELQDIVDWYKNKDIPVFGINVNPTQKIWTTSPKVYAHIYIDDAFINCPLLQDEVDDKPVGRPYVDWEIVRSLLEEQGFLK